MSDSSDFKDQFLQSDTKSFFRKGLAKTLERDAVMRLKLSGSRVLDGSDPFRNHRVFLENFDVSASKPPELGFLKEQIYSDSVSSHIARLSAYAPDVFVESPMFYNVAKYPKLLDKTFGDVRVSIHGIQNTGCKIKELNFDGGIVIDHGRLIIRGLFEDGIAQSGFSGKIISPVLDSGHMVCSSQLIHGKEWNGVSRFNFGYHQCFHGFIHGIQAEGQGTLFRNVLDTSETLNIPDGFFMVSGNFEKGILQGPGQIHLGEKLLFSFVAQDGELKEIQNLQDLQDSQDSKRKVFEHFDNLGKISFQIEPSWNLIRGPGLYDGNIAKWIEECVLAFPRPADWVDW